MIKQIGYAKFEDENEAISFSNSLEQVGFYLEKGEKEGNYFIKKKIGDK